MRTLTCAEIKAISGAAIGFDALLEMYNAGMSVNKINKLGLASATQEKKLDINVNNPGDAGYYYQTNSDGVTNQITWFNNGGNFVTKIVPVF